MCAVVERHNLCVCQGVQSGYTHPGCVQAPAVCEKYERRSQISVDKRREEKRVIVKVDKDGLK